MERDQSNLHDREDKPVACTSVGGQYTSECLVCHARIVIHCDKCGVQISGCTCTLKKRLGHELRN